MKLKIIAMGDWHISSSEMSNVNLESLKTSLLGNCLDTDIIIFTYSGDLACYGKAEEYRYAKHFFDEIKDLFEAKGVLVYFIFSPGNHDISFESDEFSEDEFSEFLESQCLNFLRNPSNKIFRRNILAAQRSFNEFADLYKDNSIKVIGDSFLDVYKYQLNNHISLSIFSLNSSFMSKKKDQYGTHSFPFNYYDEFVTDNASRINILLMHHPFSWFEYQDRKFEAPTIAQKMDIIIFGHEHMNENSIDPDLLTRYLFIKNLDNSIGDSGYTVLDFEGDKFNRYDMQYEINSNSYVVHKTTEPITITNKNESHSFSLKDKYLDFLNDIGTPISHSKGDLKLNDIFVTPRLSKKVSDEVEEMIDYTKIIQDLSIKTYKKCIVGSDKCGKTTLVKKIISHLHYKNMLPIYLDGESFTLLNKSAEANLRALISSQYNTDIDLMNNKDNIVVIIDSLDSLNARNKSKFKDFFENIMTQYEKVIITSRKNMLTTILDDIVTYDFEVIQINNFVTRQVRDLIRQWIVYKVDNIVENELLIAEDEYYKQVSELLKASNLGSKPLFILMILNSIDKGYSNIERDKDNFFSTFHSNIINDSLSIYITESSNKNAIFNFLEYLSYSFFINDQSQMSYVEFAQFHESYLIEFDITKHKCKELYSINSLIEILCKCNILLENDNFISFKHKYTYYYFISERIIKMGSERDCVIEKLSEKLYIDDYANIFIYLVHRMGEGLLEHIFRINSQINITKESLCLVNEAYIFSDMKIKIKDIDKIINEPTVIGKTAKERRDLKEDNIHENFDEHESVDNKEKTIYEAAVELNEAISAIRINEIINIVLRNYWGQLNADNQNVLIKIIIQNGLGVAKHFIDYIVKVKEKFITRVINELQEALSEEVSVFEQDKIKEEFVDRINDQLDALSYQLLIVSFRDTRDKLLIVQLYENIFKILLEEYGVSGQILSVLLELKVRANGELLNKKRLLKKMTDNREHFEKYPYILTLVKNFVADLYYNYNINEPERMQINEHLKISSKSSVIETHKGRIDRK
ncbi:metallophosphoesterase [Fusibacter tunisiensis]|uniref:DNA polymerase III delta prime subunit n=1 Tax=Fusibacter tunisiensis TaxID=1008308 RepID=A0ABS2MUB7_9FIRM|nr:metallophosphoesterase [Fusibacter tunisiensis]MBM7562955.1 DNA polymerase III delta prime subunit [Fusibacter tunisiensis]